MVLTLAPLDLARRRHNRPRPVEFHLESSHRDLEQAIHCAVAALAAERGLAVKETLLQLTSVSDRVLDFRVVCTVRALMTATLTVRGRATIGDDLCARFDSLAIEGDGMIAGLARAALEPRLEALRSRVFPIADLKLPGLVVRGVKVAAGESIRLTVSLAPRDA